MLEIPETKFSREDSSFEKSCSISTCICISPLQTKHEVINEINKLFVIFLWNDKGDKTKRAVMINDYPNGGLKMIDVVTLSKSLKASWIKKIFGFRKQ